MNIAVFDVGGTFIKHCLMIDGKITQAGKIPTPQDSQESFLKAIKAVLDKMSNIEGIAFSLPGVIDVYRQYIYAGGSCLLYTSPSPRDGATSRMPSSA
mgnify:CR=1 FL=1